MGDGPESPYESDHNIVSDNDSYLDDKFIDDERADYYGKFEY